MHCFLIKMIHPHTHMDPKLKDLIIIPHTGKKNQNEIFMIPAQGNFILKSLQSPRQWSSILIGVMTWSQFKLSFHNSCTKKNFCILFPYSSWMHI